jgi:type VI secretion system secreted protein VgrG
MEHAELFIDDTPFGVVSLRGEEAVSTMFTYEVTCAAGDVTEDAAAFIGRAAQVVVRDRFGGERRVRGIVAEAALAAHGDAEIAARFVVRPAAFRLTTGLDLRAFQEMTTADIVKEVLARGRVEARWHLGRALRKRAFTAQHRESDARFVQRLLEEEGIHTWFDHDAGSVWVLADTSPAAPELAERPRLRFTPASGMEHEDERIVALGPASVASPTAFRLRAFDPSRPSFQPAGEAGDGSLEVYDAPMGSAVDPEVLARRASDRRERAAAMRASWTGRTTSARLVPGRIFEISGHPTLADGERLFVTSYRVEIAQRRRGEGSQPAPFVATFTAQRAPLPFRPALTTKANVPAGLQSGVVVGPAGAEVHPDSGGRVRVQMHWDRQGARDDRGGTWMRVAQRGTAGSQLLPRVGWNVMTLCEEGSPDAPMAVSRFFDAEHPPPYPLPENRTRTAFKTATVPGGGSFNEIRYEDRAGAEEMFIHASRDLDVLARNDKTEAVRSRSATTVGRDRAVTVDGGATESVSGSRDLTVSGSVTEVISGSAETKVTGDAAITIAAGRDLRTGGSAELSVTGGRSVSVGAAQIDVSLGEIKAVAPAMRVLVGGALVRVTPRSITETVGTTISASDVAAMIPGRAGALAKLAAGEIPSPSVSVGGAFETVLGAKLELSGVGRSTEGGSKIREMVGGAMVLRTRDFADQAGASWSLTTAGQLTSESPKVVLEATGSIALVCGSAKIVVSSLGVTISAPIVTLQSDKPLKAVGSSVQQN